MSSTKHITQGGQVFSYMLNMFMQVNRRIAFWLLNLFFVLTPLFFWMRVTVGILIVSALFFSRLLKRDRRMWTFVVVTLVLMEELALSLWLLLGEVQIFSPHLMDGM